MQREVRSVEVSLLVHATEDEARLEEAVMDNLQVSSEPARENLEGFFGNRITHLVWHLTGEEAWLCFVALMALLGGEGRAELKTRLDSYLDEHCSLYVRLSKQALVGGVALLAPEDPVRVKVKPRGYLMKGDRTRFYSRLIEVAP